MPVLLFFLKHKTKQTMKTNRTKAGNIKPLHFPHFAMDFQLIAITDETGKTEVNIDSSHIDACECVDIDLLLEFCDYISQELPRDIIVTYAQNHPEAMEKIMSKLILKCNERYNNVN
jgi:hypothetical protein